MTETKYFTPEKAQQTLPLVKKIVKDILDTTKEMRLLADDLNGKIEDDPQIKKMLKNVEGYISELDEIGCYYKDWNFTVGLVDFPALLNGVEVFLCWRSDEDEIKYYHEIETGYSSRKLIPNQYHEN